MEIHWSIKKKRGNYRPVLSWTITLTPLEQDLGLAPIAVDTGIPKPETHWEGHCYPDRNERGNSAMTETWEVSTPSHKSGRAEGQIILPWRQENDYPEVAEGFGRVRNAMEEAVTAAAASRPMDEKGRLELGEMAKKRLAPGVAADRMLRLATKHVA